MNDLEKLGLRVKTLRKLNGDTQEALSEKIGRTVPVVSALERGINRPSFETLLRLSAALDVPLRDLFDFEGCRNESRRDDNMRLAHLAALTTAARSLETPALGWAAEIVKSAAILHRPAPDFGDSAKEQ